VNWMHYISVTWLLTALLLLIGYWTGWVPYWQAGTYGVVILGSSLIAFLMNGFDKMQARRSGRRVPERWLHILEFVGGWPGAFFGQQLFRHKTFKPSYRRIFWLMVLSHVLLVGIALFFSLDTAPAVEQPADDA